MAEREQFLSIARAAIKELQRNIEEAAHLSVEALLDEVAAVAWQGRRLALYGVGREGLAMKGFAMRLFHMGLQASVVGEMTAAPVGPGDLLIASAGPGWFSTVAALSGEARRAGARVLILTSRLPAEVQALGDVVLQVPATCLPAAAHGGGLMGTGAATAASAGTSSAADAGAGIGVGAGAGGQHAGGSPLLMGSSYELALQLFFDVACVLLQRRLGLTARPEQMVRRHTNLE